MIKPLNTDRAAEIFNSFKPQTKSLLSAFDQFHFTDGQKAVSDLKAQLQKERESPAFTEESYLNDLYVLDRYVDFLGRYGRLWEEICGEKFSDSWSLLQDALGLLRILKKFSNIPMSFFEVQLTELEKMYPYELFFSIGMVVEGLECSICGFDVDSDQCMHIRGELYSGKMASAIVQKVVQIDHAALVKNPENKRCVVEYEDTGHQFNVIRYLSNLIISRHCAISDCWHLDHSKRRVRNPDYQKRGRNEPCYCDSGKKFKQCCISKEYVEQDHVDIVREARSFEAAIV
jgi:hypothetical protein